MKHFRFKSRSSGLWRVVLW